MNHRTEPIQPSGSKPSSATQVSGPGAPDAEASEDGQVGSEQQTCLAPARGKKRRREGRKYVWLCDSSSGSFQIGCCRCPARVVILLVSTVILSLVILIIILVTILLMSPAKEDQQQRSAVDVPAPCGPACPSGWIGYEGKCYFFSEGGRNWTSGKSFCASYNSSLAVIENEPEKAFIVRYKCFTDHWIGLWKDLDHHWKWADGSELNGTLEVKGEGGGDCAFLNSGSAVSSRCYIQRNWICSHHDSYTSHKNSIGR